MDKAAARKAAFARRKGAHKSGLDAAAQAHLRTALEPHKNTALAGYMPIRTEIDPLPVMADWSSVVCVPVIQGAGLPLLFYRWTPECDMVAGPFGAAVPAVAETVIPAVLIVPLVAFDGNFMRLGYGGGFYDRTLEKLRAQQETVAIGFAYGAQEANALPMEPTDQPLDLIVTEKGIL